MAQINNGYAHYMRALMLECNVTYKDMSKEFQCTESYAWRMVNTNNPDAIKFLRLCTYFATLVKVPVEYIIERASASLGVNIYEPLQKRIYMVNREENKGLTKCEE